MLNYNKSFRERNSKSRSKSIYSGNKSHTTSMNLKVSQQIYKDFMQLPLKDIVNRNDDRRKQDYKAKITDSSRKLKGSGTSSKFNQTPVLKNTQLYERKVKPFEERCPDTDRHYEGYKIKRNFDQCNRLKTDFQECVQPTQVNQIIRTPSKQPPLQPGDKEQISGGYVEMGNDEVLDFLRKYRNLKRQKENVQKQLQFFRREAGKLQRNKNPISATMLALL